MALPDIPTEISSLTSEHHEENAKNIQKLDSLDTIYKTYVPEETNAIVTDSGKAQENKVPIRSVPPTPKLQPTTTTLASLPLAASTPTQSKAKKTLRSFLRCKIKKSHDKLSHERILSGEMMSNIRCPQCDNCDCVTPTNSNVQFNAAELNPSVTFADNQCTGANGLYEQASTERNIDGQNVGESDTSLCYCANANNPNNEDYQQQSYSCYSNESNSSYTTDVPSSVNTSTQSFSKDSCCCHSQESNSQHDYYEYEYTSDDTQQPQTYMQLTQMAQKIAQQIAQQFYQQQLCQQMGQQMGQQTSNQQMGQQMGQPMMTQSMNQPYCPSSPEECVNPQLVQQSSACSYNNEQIDQQYCGGMPQVPHYGCSPLVSTNCIDFERFLSNYPANNTSRMPMEMCGGYNGNSCNDSGAAASDMLLSQTVYSTDYKPFCPQMTPNGDSCGAQQPTYMGQYGCDCNIPGSYNMGNDFNYSYSLPTNSCSFPMPMQSTDLSQQQCETLSPPTGNAAAYDCSGTGGNNYA